MSDKMKCFSFLVSSLEALDASLEDLQEALCIAGKNNARVGETMLVRISIKLMLIHSILEQFETFSEATDTIHQHETSQKTNHPIDPSRN